MPHLPKPPEQRAVVDRVIYATITLMSVLIIYDGWHQLRLVDVVGVIVGPVLAMFFGHVFSAIVSRQVATTTALGRNDWLRIVRAESRFLFMCVPPLAVVLPLYAFGVSLSTSIQVVTWLGAASLGYWGFVAGRRAGFVGWHLALSVIAGLFVGVVVLLLQVVLQPGKVVG
jgi:hypothetical protein